MRSQETLVSFGFVLKSDSFAMFEKKVDVAEPPSYKTGGWSLTWTIVS